MIVSVDSKPTDHSEPLNESQLLKHSLAQQLWFPWNLIVKNPLQTTIIYTILNIIFIILGWIIRELCNLITFTGVIFVFFIVLFYGLRRVAIIMTYPGQLNYVVHEAERYYSRVLYKRLQKVCDLALELQSVLIIPNKVDVNTASQSDISSLKNKIHVIHSQLQQMITAIIDPLYLAMETVDSNGELSANGKQLMQCLASWKIFFQNTFQNACEEIINCPNATFMGDLSRFLHQPYDDYIETKLNEHISSINKSLVTILSTHICNMQLCMELLCDPENAESQQKSAKVLVSELLFPPQSNSRDKIADLNLMRADLAAQFNGEQIWIPGYNNHLIDAMFIPAGGLTITSSAPTFPTMIICNPNGGLYELMHLQSTWISFYTGLQCNVLVYNYRGYGRNSGAPSPYAHNQDILAIINYLRNERKILGKLAVHGESVGGLSATYAARYSPDINVLIADRTFSSLPMMAKKLIGLEIVGQLFSALTWWEADNVINYLNASCHKIVCNDTSDDVIEDDASLKTGIAIHLEFPLLNEHTKMSYVQSKFRKIYKVLRSGTVSRVVRPITSSCMSSQCLNKWTRLPQDEVSEVESTSEECNSTSLKLYPIIGVHIDESDCQPFTLDSIIIFSKALHSLAQTVMNKGNTISSPPTDNTLYPINCIEIIWKELACMDGYCGSVLLQALEAGSPGNDQLKEWIASCIFWGGQLPIQKRNELSCFAYDRDGFLIQPSTIHEVYARLSRLVQKYPAINEDTDIAVVMQMLTILTSTLTNRWTKLDENSTHLKERKKYGQLLPLHCGHNKDYIGVEKLQLVAFLRQVGFLIQ